MAIVLLIGQQKDPQIVAISNELRRFGEQYYVINRLSVPDSINVKLDSNSVSSTINVNRKTLFANTIKSIWNSSSLKISLPDVSRDAREFLLAEWKEAIYSLWYSIEAKWVNHPSAIFLASNKLKQLALASDINLRTPKTLITNDSKAFLEFYNECNNNIIVKTLHGSSYLPKNKAIYTTKVTKDDINHAGDLKYGPCMFQEYIPKKSEFRITIIGDNLHATEIQSQQSNKTLVDWRRHDDFSKTPYAKSELPADVQNKLLKLMKVMKLEFGAIDLVQTPQDEFIFLEVNSNGYWWWIQELTGINIAKDIANNLTSFTDIA